MSVVPVGDNDHSNLRHAVRAYAWWFQPAGGRTALAVPVCGWIAVGPQMIRRGGVATVCTTIVPMLSRRQGNAGRWRMSNSCGTKLLSCRGTRTKHETC